MDTSVRKVCPHCEEELAHTAYSRHQSDRTGRICPGKSVCYERERSPRATDLDSTFDFGSASDNEDDFEDNSFTHFPGDIQEESEAVVSDIDSDNTVSSDGEIWDDTESSEKDSEAVASSSSVSEIVTGISFFLTYYHLLYRLSECAITSLLKFIA